MKDKKTGVEEVLWEVTDQVRAARLKRFVVLDALPFANDMAACTKKAEERRKGVWKLVAFWLLSTLT